ncbi:M4 family metallopeptidase [soil metagenome]
MVCFIVPPYLLERIASLDDPRFTTASAAAQQSLALVRPYVGVMAGEAPPPTRIAPRSLVAGRTIEAVRRTLSDAHNSEKLPGTLVRSEGDAATSDSAVTEAWAGLGDTHALYAEVYDRASIDDDNLRLDATVHYGDRYDNAFWNGERMIFGDGDNEVFTRFTASVSVIGHELTHGVTQYTAGLDYQGQSGALNESISDVFGALVEQYSLGQTVAQASWLIGSGIFTDHVQGSAIRSMKAPGTAYDDDVLGKDPQPADMSGYVETTDDNAGVHLNSGIPNRAFYLVAAALGGNAWKGAGQIWYDTLTGGTLSTAATFAEFATATAGAARARFGQGAELDAVVAAWSMVGVK